MSILKNKLKENERTRRRDLCRLFSLDTGFPDKRSLPEEPVVAQPEPQRESVVEILERVFTPEGFRLLKRLMFDWASHQQAAQEFGISVYVSQERLGRIRDKLYTVFPERKRWKKK